MPRHRDFDLGISIASKPQRPFPEKEIIWGSQEGGQAIFPSVEDARLRRYSDDAAPLKVFGKAVSSAQERIWIVDEYLLKPDSEKSSNRIEKILEWLPYWLAASDVRLLTKPHQEVGEDDLSKFRRRAQEINDHAARREKECRIEVKMHLKRNCDYIHDRFAIVDDELWHFGGTVGGFHSSVSAASRGWRASDHNAVAFFEEIWRAGDRK